MSACFCSRITLLARNEILRRQRFINPLISSHAYYSAKIGGKEEANKKVVYLLDVEGKHLGTKLLSDAESLAKKNKLLLVCTDKSTKYPTYKLEPKNAAFQNIDSVSKSSQKERKKSNVTNQIVFKNLVLTTKVSDHDLDVKLSAVKKWLQHGFEIKVLVTGDSSMFDKVFTKISTLLKDYATLKQKQVSNNLKFIAVPSASLTSNSDKLTESDANTSTDDIEDPNDIINRELQQLLNNKTKN